jgi:integrase
MAPRKSRRPTRRKPNTGAIRYKKGRAQPYEAAFPLEHDKYRYDYFSARSEAEAHLDRLTAERDHRETPRNITAGSQRVDQFLPSWLLTKRGRIKEKTLLGYTYYCELASGEIGGYRIDEVTRERGDAMFTYFAEAGFRNVAQMRAVLIQAFEYAHEEGYIRKNPFKKTTIPTIKHRKAIALTSGQRAHLLGCAAIEDRMRTEKEIIPLCALWHLYSRVGLRKGEGIGLLWANVRRTETGPEIIISQHYTNVGSRTERSTPKSPRSYRTVPIPEDLYDLLMVLKQGYLKRAAADPEWENHGVVFAGPHGRPLSVWYVRNRWEKLRGRAPIPQQTTIHDLRHTALTIWEQGGVPQSVRMALAGHSTAAMAAHYTDHADMESMRRAIEKSG